MAKRKGNLLWQLTLSLGLAIVFLSLASFYYQYRVQRHILVTSIRDDLMRQANLLRCWLDQGKTPAERRKIAAQYVETIDHFNKSKQEIVVVGADRKILAANGDLEAGQEFGSSTLDEAMTAARAGRRRASVEVAGAYQIALPCYAGASRKTVVAGILLKQPLTAVDQLADSMMLGAFVLLAVTLVIIVLVVHYVLRVKVHKPMQAIFMQEYRIREGDLARIEAPDPRNEFSDLYAMYNEMVVRIAEQKRAIIEQKDHVALAQLVRQTISKLTGPLDEILTQSRTLLEHQSSLSPDDRTTLKQILTNVTRIARELKSIVVQGDKSATWLKREAEKIREHTRPPDAEQADNTNT